MYLLQPGSFPLKIETTKPSLVCRLRGKYPLGLFLFLKGIKKNIFFPYQLATTDTGISSEYVIDFYCPFGPPPSILSLACDTILIISQEALFCCPHRLHLFHSPQHSWGIRLFIYNSHPTDYNKECPFACKGAEPYPSASGRYDRKMNLKEWKKEQWM